MKRHLAAILGYIETEKLIFPYKLKYKQILRLLHWFFPCSWKWFMHILALLIKRRKYVIRINWTWKHQREMIIKKSEVACISFTDLFHKVSRNIWSSPTFWWRETLLYTIIGQKVDFNTLCDLSRWTMASIIWSRQKSKWKSLLRRQIGHHCLCCKTLELGFSGDAKQ